MKKTFTMIPLLFAAACGGGGGDPDANLTGVPDARPTADAAPEEGLFLWNWVVTIDGKGAEDLFQFIMPRPAPAADLNVALDLVQACTANVDYCMVGLGDYNFTTGEEVQFFYPNTGTLTISAAEDRVGGDFTVTMTAARFDEYDSMTAMQIDPQPDGSSLCNATSPAFGPITIPVQDPAAFAPSDDPRFAGKKWGRYQRPEPQQGSSALAPGPACANNTISNLPDGDIPNPDPVEGNTAVLRIED
jgi:hypothetical protein